MVLCTLTNEQNAYYSHLCMCVEIITFLQQKQRVPNSDLRDMLSEWGQQHMDNDSIYQCSLSVWRTNFHLHSVVNKYIILEVRETKHFPSSWNSELPLHFLLQAVLQLL